MNSYGLALVCADHGVPLFSWKIISDRADEEAAETLKAFTANYSGEGGKALAEVLQSLPPQPQRPVFLSGHREDPERVISWQPDHHSGTT